MEVQIDFRACGSFCNFFVHDPLDVDNFERLKLILIRTSLGALNETPPHGPTRRVHLHQVRYARFIPQCSREYYANVLDGGGARIVTEDGLHFGS